MLLIFRLLLVAALVKTFVAMEGAKSNWFAFAAVFAAVGTFFHFALAPHAWWIILIAGVIRLAAASLYFWLLEFLEGAEVFWWLVMAPGALILVIL